MTIHRTLLPPDWKRPKGYSNGVSARGRAIYTAGVLGWDKDERFVALDLVGQFRQVLINTIAILAEDGAGPDHITRMTWYITSRDDYLANIAGIGAAYKELIGGHFPAMAVVEVSALIEADAMIEIETIAVVPD